MCNSFCSLRLAAFSIAWYKIYYAPILDVWILTLPLLFMYQFRILLVTVEITICITFITLVLILQI